MPARRWAILVTALSLVFGALLMGPLAASAQEPPLPYTGDVPSGGGVSLLIATQDTRADVLAEAFQAVGCTAQSIAITEGGAWRVYIPGAPSFVNEAFPAQLPQGTVFALSCAAPYVEPTAQDAVAVLEAYFADLDAGRYDEAYSAWQSGANPQTLAEFTAGYAGTASVLAEVGAPGPIDAGAGQRFIEIPVTIEATLTDGTVQHFEGTYVLHHTANIPGATAEQLAWHIRSATVSQTD